MPKDEVSAMRPANSPWIAAARSRYAPVVGSVLSTGAEVVATASIGSGQSHAGRTAARH